MVRVSSSSSERRFFKVGARGSALSVAQTRLALKQLAGEFPGITYRLVRISTPGDRDLVTPIDRAADDFFTRDLDEAVLAGRIDFAVHSAKDMPARIVDGLDFVWLPWRADPRDCWVFRKGEGGRAETDGSGMRVGISSERRNAYALKRFPRAVLAPVRGAIDSRIRQLRDGDYDAVLMAAAGLNRLYPRGVPGVEVIPIPTDELPPPEAQGVLALVFRAGDERLRRMRARFVKAVRFVSAGTGDASLCTLAGADDIALADTVLYDDLLGAELASRPRPGQKFVRVGKRCGAHSMKQADITRLICDEARRGRRVVRLKGGDAGIFGRLAEETDALETLAIPYVVRPGVSALTAATTPTGMLLTRRGESAGFSVYTPRRAAEGADGSQVEGTLVEFMAAKMAAAESRRLVAECGWSASTPCAIVWDACGPREEVFRSTLAKMSADAGVMVDDDRPGLFVVGRAALGKRPCLGEYGGRRMLLTCSTAVAPRASCAVEDRGGVPVRFPLIELRPSAAFRRFLRRSVGPGGEGMSAAERYDALVFTSPSAVRVFFDHCQVDRRRLGEIYTCGAGTDAEVRRYGLRSDVMPERNFSADGLVAEIAGLDLTGRRILRLASAKAGPKVAQALERAGATVEELVLYDNVPTAPAALPRFDDVFFASASAVEVFLARYGAKAMKGRGVYVIGSPTRSALPRSLAARACLFPMFDVNR